mmetsp:Transcript_25020/g.54857  ORF Transcript_25020/g.54857 Transcript_25020/m.54857 type:complete len:540 (-) Transcript_25020:34-1653(-)
MVDIIETNDGVDGKSQLGETTATTPPSMVVPAVVACGYRQVIIPKSGNQFPAFLVAIPNEQKRCIAGNGDDCCSDADGKNATMSSTSIRFAWRSKRDFMLLARSTTSQALPKAALKNVVESSAIPWRRFTSNSCGDSDMDVASNNIPHFLSDSKLPNRFSARMKKSVWKLDRFLQESYAETITRENTKKAWELFCRPADTEDLVTPREFVPGATRSVKERSENNGEPNQSIEEKSVTTKISDPSFSFTSNHDRSTTTLAESSRLGQYFASEENSRRVVECALEKILPLYGDGSNHNILFIEPSCGHGDIIVALVKALKRHKIPPQSVFIQGYDIDHCAIKTCRQRVEFPRSTKFYTNGIIDGFDEDDGYWILWDCSSFFETARQKCISSFDSSYVNVVSNSKSERGEDKKMLVCCLGGPPYTTGQGSGSGIQRDLPTRFVQHCRNEWKADVITFLLPARYREEMQHNTTDCTFASRTTAIAASTGQDVVTAVNTSTISQETCRNTWFCETEELKASTFFFRGTTRVTQPSIIQTFYSGT